MATCPKIRRSSVEVKHESLSRSADLDGTEILGVVLLVLSSHFSGLASAGILLRENAVGMSSASKLMESIAMSLGLSGLLCVEVWARHGGLEAPFLEEVDIGLGTRSLVLLVGYKSDLLQSLERHDEWNYDILYVERGKKCLYVGVCCGMKNGKGNGGEGILL